MIKLLVSAPSSIELKKILDRTTGSYTPEIQPVFEPETAESSILEMKKLVREVYVAEPLQEILVRMLSALTHGSSFSSQAVTENVQYGPGPRGAQSILLMAKVYALLDRRINLAFEDILAVIVPCLRHRLIMSFKANVRGVSADDVIREIKTAK